MYRGFKSYSGQKVAQASIQKTPVPIMFVSLLPPLAVRMNPKQKCESQRLCAPTKSTGDRSRYFFLRKTLPPARQRPPIANRIAVPHSGTAVAAENENCEEAEGS